MGQAMGWKVGWDMGWTVGLIGVSWLLGGATAQACTLGPLAAASGESRMFTSDRHGLTVALPSNYRAALTPNGDIALQNPAVFEYGQCLTRNRQPGRIPLHTVLEVRSLPTPGQDLVALLRQYRPWLDVYRPTWEPTEFAGQPALRYDYVHALQGVTMANITFLSPDRRTLFTLTGPRQDPAWERAIAAFQFN